jgi:4-amino-4-deoxy-L-arabinose transferase-like glycosyltransferase
MFQSPTPNANFTTVLKYLIGIALVIVPLFSHLDTLPIRLWDESRLAINAYEMFRNHNFLVTYFEGQPDLWNTKPPLLIWMQVFWMYVIGPGEIALRLPNAFAGLFLFIAVVVFSVKFLKYYWFGFIAVMILLTSFGFVFNHSIRTANYDGMLALFTTLSGLLFFAHLETKRNTFLYGFFLTLALAVLTKSISGLLFLPALAIYSLGTKNLLPLLRNRNLYVGAVLFIVTVGGYYFLREWASPGYLAAVYQNELGGRYMETLENNASGFWYYFDQFTATHLSAWYLLFPIGLVMGLVHTNPKINRLTIYSALLSLVYFLVISTSQTKLSWYDIPMYPFLAFVLVVPVYFVFDLLRQKEWISEKLRYNVLPFAFLFLVFFGPYSTTWETIMDPKKSPEDESFYQMGYYFQDALKGREDVDGFLYINNEYMPNNEFYMHLLRDQGKDIKNGGDYTSIPSGSNVIAYQGFIMEYVENHYVCDILQSKNGIKKYHIHDIK